MRTAIAFVLLALCATTILAKDPINPKDAKVTHTVTFAVSIDGQLQDEKISIGLFGDIVPKTTENFRKICVGTEANGKKLSYNDVPFHRIIPKFMIQGGDFTNKDGTGGFSIYGNKFNDENFDVRHDVGVISMANAGPNTNGSQFFITVAPTPWLDGRHTVFGRIVSGLGLIKKIEEYGTQSGKPKAKISIASCTEEDAPADL